MNDDTPADEDEIDDLVDFVQSLTPAELAALIKRAALPYTQH